MKRKFKMLPKGIFPSDLEVSRTISLISDSETNEILDWVKEERAEKVLGNNRKTLRIGVTGGPGVGKSSFINALIGQLNDGQNRIAVIAIDPTSPNSQGAVLGDRIRINVASFKENVFIRSMASRGGIGGVPPKLQEILDYLEASQFNILIVETVGIGQIETQIFGVVERVVNVIDSRVGDEIQALKAGIFEMRCIHFVNKKDLGINQSLVSELQESFLVEDSGHSPQSELVIGCSLTGEGVRDVVKLLGLEVSRG